MTDHESSVRTAARQVLALLFAIAVLIGAAFDGLLLLLASLNMRPSNNVHLFICALGGLSILICLAAVFAQTSRSMTKRIAWFLAALVSVALHTFSYRLPGASGLFH